MYKQKTARRLDFDWKTYHNYLDDISFTIGLYYERGCAEQFSKWMKGWAGGMSAALCIMAVVEVNIKN